MRHTSSLLGEIAGAQALEQYLPASLTLLKLPCQVGLLRSECPEAFYSGLKGKLRDCMLTSAGLAP